MPSRNIDEIRYSFDTAGYIGFGDQSGAKQSTAKTYLQDAQDRGAVIVANCFAERVLLDGDRATGVQARFADPASGHNASVTVQAPQVIVACGALESPALLLRSGIGGRAVGDYLRLHPCTALFGYYPEDTQAWRGAPHAGLVHEFENVEDGYGFLIEGAQYTTGLAASALAYTDGPTHKAAMAQLPPRRDVHSAAARPRPRAGDDRSRRIVGAQLRADRRARHPQHPSRDRRPGAAARGGGRPADRRRGRGLADLALGRRPPGLRGSCPADPAPRGRLDAVRSAPDGQLPDGARTRPPASPTPGASCTTPRGSGSVMEAPSPPPRVPTR